jgi:hypothetical protein
VSDMQSTDPFALERAEAATLLASRELQRAQNLQRILAYICEMYFAGRAEEIKEYTIAVHALGRSEDYEPANDSIVRVSASNLRKRLDHYYETEGAEHAVHILLPVGQYVPQFIRKGASETGPSKALMVAGSEASSPDSGPPKAEAVRSRTRSLRLAIYLAALAGLVVLAFLGYRGWHRGKGVTPPKAAAVPAWASEKDEVRLLLGAEERYVDKAGRSWNPVRDCAGGRVFHRPGRPILGTSDPELCRQGREGAFSLRLPLKPGVWELHLLFADVFNSDVAARRVNLAINGGALQTLDIVDEGEGSDRAVVKVFTDLEPMADGQLHLDFSGETSYLNALELLPGQPGGMRPLRITTSPEGCRDSLGQRWLPDQFVYGGMENRRKFPTIGASEDGLFQYERFGQCRYILPVAPGHLYTVRLYFSEGWFGPGKWIAGGPGSRVFDVVCNGETRLKDFDILGKAKPGQEAVIETFSHVVPTQQSKIHLQFIAKRDYPLINAIEVISE